MHPADILSAVKKAASSASAIARDLVVTPTSIRNVIFGQGRSRRIEHRISEITGLPLHQLWPQWYAQPTGIEHSTDPFDAIPARLVAERERLGFDQKTMAALGCMSLAEQKRMECGALMPHALYLCRLARSTHFDALYVITGRREVGRV